VLQVITPIRGSPAHKKGILTGDIIKMIVREEDSQGNKLDKPEEIPTKGLAVGDAVKKIKGAPGTRVKLIIEREGEKEDLTLEVTRGRVEVETVLGHRRKENGDWSYVIDETNRIAYARLTSFGRNTADNLSDRLKDLKKDGIKGFVLDLRFNPGGLLTSAVDVTDLFVEDGRIVTVRPRLGAGSVEAHDGKTEGSHLNFPMVCLVNGGSASGSEIVAAALQDQARAVIIGERSYGKGSVQNVLPFEGGDMKMTIATFWRPNDKNLNKSSTKGGEDEDWGVRPNKGYLVELTTKDRDDLFDHQRNTEIIARPDRYVDNLKKLDEFKDVQMERALEYLRAQIKLAGSSKNGD
jgi:carboxyl-terminal processing protease